MHERCLRGAEGCGRGMRGVRERYEGCMMGVPRCRHTGPRAAACTPPATGCPPRPRASEPPPAPLTVVRAIPQKRPDVQLAFVCRPFVCPSDCLFLVCAVRYEHSHRALLQRPDYRGMSTEGAPLASRSVPPRPSLSDSAGDTTHSSNRPKKHSKTDLILGVRVGGGGEVGYTAASAPSPGLVGGGWRRRRRRKGP